ncbi:MAG: hypothetical protein ACR2LE_03725 [Nocardioidaceae bacterium]
MTKSSGSARHIGKTTLVDDAVESLDASYGNFMQRLRVSPSRACPRYVWYLLNHDTVRSQFGDLSTTTTGLANLNATTIGSVLVPWFPLPEQRAIADYLDRETAQIDALIGKQERLIETLRERRASVIDNMVLPGASSAPTDPKLTWRGHRAVGPAINALPDGWRVLRFKAALERLDRRNDNGDMTMMSLKSSGEIVPRSTLGERQEPDPASIPRYLAIAPEHLVVNPMWLIGGAIGVSNAFGAVSPDYRVFRSRGYHHPRYLHHLLRSRPYRAQYVLYTRSNTTFDRRVQQPDLDNLPLAVPPLPEQALIARRIDDQTAKVDALIAKAERFIEVSKERRSALITAVVTGQFDVRPLMAQRVGEAGAQSLATASSDSAEQEVQPA